MLTVTMLLPFASQAQNTLTVADGTATNSYVPVYGLYVDDFVRCQTVYPASMLTSMSGQSILGVTYYLSSPATASWGVADFVVKVTEVADTTLTGFLDMTGATTVYTGSLDGTQSTMEIEFTTPYTYSGGNLLIEIYNTVDGTYKSASFYGISASGASWQGYNSSSWTAVTGSARDFIPKTTFAYGNPPTCFRVSNQAVDASLTTPSSLTISWTDLLNTNATYSVYDMSDTSLIQSGITAMSYTVTGLDANTLYTFGIQTDCGAGDIAAGYAVAGGRTACAPIAALPYTDGMEEYPTGNYPMPFCWGRYTSAFTTAATYPYDYNSNAHSGSRSLYFYGATTAAYPDTMVAILPGLDVSTYPMNGNRVTFWAKMGSASNSKNVYVGTLTNAADPTTFTLIDSVTVTGNTYTLHSVALSNASATDPYVALVVLKGTGTMYIDDVTLEEMPSCLEITNLATGNITSSSVELSWNDPSNSSATYTVYNMADSTVVASNVNALTYTVTGLSANTQYTFGVQANCSAGDAAIMTVSALTSCADENMPWSENFDDWSTKSACWMFLSGAYNGGNGTPTANASAWTLNSTYGNYITISGKALTMNIYSTNRYWAVTPPINIVGDAMLSVDVAVAAWSSSAADYDANDTVAFAASTDGGTTWTNLRVLDNAELNSLGNTYTTISVPIVGYNGQTVRFAIFGGSSASGGDNRIAIDNVIVDVAPSCLPVTALAASAVTTETATLTWNGDATSYNVYALGADGSMTLVQNVATTTITLSGLTAMTQYTYGVTALCGTDESSMVTVTFNTACTAVSLPFSENFEATSNTINCWSTDGTGNWSIGTGDYSSSTGAYEGATNAVITHGNTGDQTKLISPILDGVDNGMTISFAYVMRSWSGDIDELNVYTRASETAPWNQVAAYTTEAATWTTASIDVTGTVYQVAFEFVDNYGYGLGIDNVSFTEINGGSDTTGSDTTGTCVITILAEDAWGDGWGDATLTVSQNGATLLTYSMADQNESQTTVSETVTVNVNGDMPVYFIWNDGSELYNDEVGFTILDGGGAVVYTIADASTLTNGNIFTLNNACPTCIAPVVTIDSVSTTSVTISWTGDAASYSVYNGTTYVGSTTANTYSISGLNAATTYIFGVVAVCSADDSSTMTTVSTRTDCTNGSCEISVVTGPYGLLGAGIEVKQNGIILGVLTDISEEQVTLTMSVCSGEPVELNYIQTPYADYGLASYISFTILDGGGATVYTCTDASTLTSGHLTLITTPCPSCILPVVTVDGVTQTTATISWTSSASSFNIYNDTVFVANVSTNTYTFAGLTPGTNYTFGVQAMCSASDASGIATVTAFTACSDVTTLPYVYGFEEGLGCWTSVNGSADGIDWMAISNNSDIAPHSGSTAAVSFSWSSSAMHADAWLISPKFVLPTIAAGDTLNFAWWFKVNGAYPLDLYDVMLSTTTNDTASFVNTLASVIPDSSNDEYTQMVVDLSAWAGQSVYIAFHHHDSYDMNYLLIDDISLSVGAAPEVPVDTLTVTFTVNDPTMGTTVPAPGTYQYIAGDTVYFTALPNTGYVFNGWVLSVAGVNDTIGPEYYSAFFPAAAMMSYGSFTLEALFGTVDQNSDSMQVNVAVNDPTMGTTVPAPGTHYFHIGEVASVQAVPNPGYVLQGWTVTVLDAVEGVVYVDTTYNNPVSNVFDLYGGWVVTEGDQDYIWTVTANFVRRDGESYVVTAVCDPEMGYVTGAGEYQAGANVVLTANNLTGFEFVAWVENGDTVGRNSVYVINNIDADHTLEAVFTAVVGIDDVDMDNVNIYSVDSRIMVNGAEGQRVVLFDVNGRMLSYEATAGENVEFRVNASGVYLVKVGEAAAKRVVVIR